MFRNRGTVLNDHMFISYDRWNNQEALCTHEASDNHLH
jgi:hypothetical protein